MYILKHTVTYYSVFQRVQRPIMIISQLHATVFCPQRDVKLITWVSPGFVIFNPKVKTTPK